MRNDAARITENVAAIRRRIAETAVRSGRTTEAVTLVAVTKYVSAGVARLLVEAGCHDLGESRPQQLWEKAAELAGLPIRWHLIGHLQRNKVRRTLPLLAMLHSVDSPRLLAAIDEEHHSWGGSCTATPSRTSRRGGSATAAPTTTASDSARSEHLPRDGQGRSCPRRDRTVPGQCRRLSPRVDSRSDVHGGSRRRPRRRPPRVRRLA